MSLQIYITNLVMSAGHAQQMTNLKRAPLLLLGLLLLRHLLNPQLMLHHLLL
jgi:hypothetical protein